VIAFRNTSESDTSSDRGRSTARAVPTEVHDLADHLLALEPGQQEVAVRERATVRRSPTIPCSSIGR
jgi:hypothetical protein